MRYLESFGQKYGFLGQKNQCSVFGQEMHYYMAYIEMNLQIQAEPKHLSQISKHSPDKKFEVFFAQTERL